jgi:hypothetical protein
MVMGKMVERGWLVSEARLEKDYPAAAERFVALGLTTNVQASLQERLRETPGGWTRLARALDGAPSSAGELIAALRTAMPSPYAAFCLGLLQARAGQNLSRAMRRACLELALQMTDEEKHTTSRYLFDHPEIMGPVSGEFARVERMVNIDGGTCEDTFALFAQAFLPRGDAYLPDDSAIAEALTEQLGRVPKVELDTSDARLRGANGRTLALGEPDGPAQYPKIFKPFEEKDELLYEAAVLQVISPHAEEWGWQSELPKPLGMTRFVLTQAMRAALDGQEHNAGRQLVREEAGESVDAYAYEASNLYQKYPRQALTSAVLREILHRFHHDTGTAAGRAGLVFDESADLFHNRGGKRDGWKVRTRAYLWSIDLLRAGQGAGRGTGHLADIDRTEAFPNYGLAGVRDYKQFKTLSNAWRRAGSQFETQAEFLLTRLGEPLFASTISVMNWYASHRCLHHVEDMAQTLRNNFLAFLIGFTGREEGVCASFLDASINWQLMATQVKEGYETNYRHNGKQDLGFYNGPLPLPELVCALYVTTSMAIHARDRR